jgi:hypothetical protein
MGTKNYLISKVNKTSNHYQRGLQNWICTFKTKSFKVLEPSISKKCVCDENKIPSEKALEFTLLLNWSSQLFLYPAK